MKKIFNKVIGIFILIIMQIIPVSNAAIGGSVGLTKTEVEQGGIFEVYVTLDVISEAYDIKFEINDSDLIKGNEVVPTISNNKLSGGNRIYLIQIDEESNRTKHPVGTKVACMRYTVSDMAAVGSEITVTVTGDIVGENNSENSINEVKKIKIIEKEKEQEKEEQGQKQDDENTEEQGNKQDNENTEELDKKDDTIVIDKDLPQTGNKRLYIFIIVCTLMIIAFALYYKYKKINFK